MDEIEDQQLEHPIEIKKPINGKFFKELGHIETTTKRSKKKSQLTNNKSSEQQSPDKNLLKNLNKSLKRLPEVNRNGNRIRAEWKNDQIHGDAEIHYKNGVTFKGVYQNGIKIEGHFKFLNGFQYVGNCLGNKFNGEGTLMFPSGKKISGEWNEYQIVGSGKIEYPKGEVYYGEIEAFKKHGKGNLFFNDGSKYVGDFQKGLITGVGVYYIDDKQVSSGLWKNGQLIQEYSVDQGSQEFKHEKGDKKENKQNNAVGEGSLTETFGPKKLNKQRSSEVEKINSQMNKLNDLTPRQSVDEAFSMTKIEEPKKNEMTQSKKDRQSNIKVRFVV